MSEKQPITKEYFIKRLGELCLKSGLPGFPKDETDQHILLKSAILMAGQAGDLTEKQVNAFLETWVKNVCQIKTMDRVTLRRRLVDTGYLTRSKDGAFYQVAGPGPRAELFEAAVDEVDPVEAIATAREEIARRKREYLEKSRGA